MLILYNVMHTYALLFCVTTKRQVKDNVMRIEYYI